MNLSYSRIFETYPNLELYLFRKAQFIVDETKSKDFRTDGSRVFIFVSVNTEWSPFGYLFFALWTDDA